MKIIEAGITPENLFEISAQQELQARPERLGHLNERVEQLFPGEKLAALRSKISESFNVPQWGPYHSEGMLMDTHIEKILEKLTDIESGVFPSELAPEAREILNGIVLAHKKSLERYAFLHDLEKPNCLQLKFSDPEKSPLEIDWEGWKAMVPGSAATNPIELQQWLRQQGIASISYFHGQEGTKKNHGDEAAKILKGTEQEISISPALLVAITHHEVAYQFQEINGKVYARYFGSMTPEERRLALAGSYLDTSASFRINSRPDLKNFNALLYSFLNFEIIESVRHELATDQTINQKIVEQELNKALKSKMLLSREVLTRDIRERC